MIEGAKILVRHIHTHLRAIDLSALKIKLNFQDASIHYWKLHFVSTQERLYRNIWCFDCLQCV